MSELERMLNDSNINTITELAINYEKVIALNKELIEALEDQHRKTWNCRLETEHEHLKRPCSVCALLRRAKDSQAPGGTK